MTYTTINEVISEIDRRIARINNTITTLGKRYHYLRILELFNEYPDVQKYYGINSSATFYKDKIIKKDIPTTGISEYDTHRNWQYSDTKEGGLYFMGNIEYNPTLQKPIYWVKIGIAENIKKRMNAYRTHNPSYWHNNCVLIEPDTALRDIYENWAHHNLEKQAIQTHPNAWEWYEVTEETYFKLCEKLQTQEGFMDFVEEGKSRI